jgi:hypothetical protein
MTLRYHCYERDKLLTLYQGAAGWTGLGCYFETNPQIQWRLCLALQSKSLRFVDSRVRRHSDAVLFF